MYSLYDMLSPEQKSQLDWEKLSSNPEAIYILLDNQENIVVPMLSANTAPQAIDILDTIIKANPNDDRINWPSLSANPSAGSILEEIIRANPMDGRINWHSLSENTSPEAIEILTRYIDNPVPRIINKINWNSLSKNKGAIEILKEEVRKPERICRVNFYLLSENPGLFEKTFYPSK